MCVHVLTRKRPTTDVHWSHQRRPTHSKSSHVKDLTNVSTTSEIRTQRVSTFKRHKFVSTSPVDTNFDPVKSQSLNHSATFSLLSTDCGVIRSYLGSTSTQKNWHKVLIPPRQPVVWTHNVLVHMTTKPHADGLDPTSQPLTVTWCLLFTYLIPFWIYFGEGIWNTPNRCRWITDLGSPGGCSPCKMTDLTPCVPCDSLQPLTVTEIFLNTSRMSTKNCFWTVLLLMLV